MEGAFILGPSGKLEPQGTLMNALLVNQVVGSPVLAKLILLVCIAVLFLYLRRKDTERQSNAFLALLGILLTRDFLSASYASPGFFYISDLVYLSFALFILLAPFDRSRPALVFAIGFNAVVAALYLGVVVFNFSIGLPVADFGYILVGNAFFAGMASLVNRKDRSTPARLLVSRLWPLAALFLITYTVLAVVMGYDDPLFSGFVMPLSYAWLLAAALLFSGIHEAELVTALAYYEAAMDSLYTMFLNTGSALEDDNPDQDVLRYLNDTLIAETGADGGVILVPEGVDRVVVKAYAGFFPPLLPVSGTLPGNAKGIEAFMKQARFGLGKGILGEVAKTGKNVYCPAAERDPRFMANSKDEFLRITSFMAVPLMIEDRILGVAALVRTSAGSSFKEEDFDRFKLLANFGSFAVHAVASSGGDAEGSGKSTIPGTAETDGAIELIRQSTLARSLPRCPGLSVDVMMVPAPGSAGTYYDLIQARRDRVIGVLAEAGGQGIRSALVLVMLKSILHVLGRTDKDMAAVLNWANRVLHGSIEPSLASSVGLACLNPRTGAFEYANAGRMSLLVYRQGTKALDYISRSSIPIGKERVADYERIRLQLNAGDLAVLYTDGVTGCLDCQGNEFGRSALGRAIVRHADSDAGKVTAGILSAISTFSEGTAQRFEPAVLVLKLEQA
jgi:sigma-B regulation protein RsbU (phosphoserine phosphatase)